MRFGVCAMVRDELHHILEWLAFHSIIGAERFWLALNDPEPGPLQRQLAAPVASGVVCVRSMPGDAQQLAGYAWGLEGCGSFGDVIGMSAIRLGARSYKRSWRSSGPQHSAPPIQVRCVVRPASHAPVSSEPTNRLHII
jgi:hypothetical protein